MTPLKRQKREEITSPQPPKQALATPTRPTPEKKAKTKAANDQQLRSPPPKGQIISKEKQALATNTRPTQEKKAKTKAVNDQQLKSPPPKGQIISEGNFGLLNFPKKSNETILRISGLASKINLPLFCSFGSF